MEYYLNSDCVLNHHGVKGQKWGERHDRSKTGMSSKAKAKKKDTGISAIISRRKAARLKAERAKSRQKQMKTAEKQLSVEERKAAILKQRSGKAIYKNADLFTTDELAAAARRLQLEKTLREIDPKQKTKAEQYLEKAKKMNDTMATVNNTIKTGAELYQTVDKYLNPSNKKKD